MGDGQAKPALLLGGEGRGRRDRGAAMLAGGGRAPPGAVGREQVRADGLDRIDGGRVEGRRKRAGRSRDRRRARSAIGGSVGRIRGMRVDGHGSGRIAEAPAHPAVGTGGW